MSKTPSWLPSGGEIIGGHGGRCVERWYSILTACHRKTHRHNITKPKLIFSPISPPPPFFRIFYFHAPFILTFKGALLENRPYRSSQVRYNHHLQRPVEIPGGCVGLRRGKSRAQYRGCRRSRRTHNQAFADVQSKKDRVRENRAGRFRG